MLPAVNSILTASGGLVEARKEIYHAAADADVSSGVFITPRSVADSGTAALVDRAANSVVARRLSSAYAVPAHSPLLVFFRALQIQPIGVVKRCR